MSPTARLLDALAFAAHKHRDQRRKDVDASPYINHPIALARVLSVEAGIDDEDVLIAAVLHDTVEDTDTTLDELRARFGERIAGLVAEVTDDVTLDRATRKRLQIEHAPTLSREAALVKLADKICNLRDVADNPPPDWPLARRREYFDWAGKVIAGLRGVHVPLEALFDAASKRCPEPSGHLCVGVDGCRAGWLTVHRDGGNGAVSIAVLPTAQAVLERFPEARMIAVDIPIGLNDRDARTADRLARKRLGPTRGTSVFSSPIRPVIHATTYLEARQLHRAADGRSLSAQAFALLPKIVEWDRLLRDDSDARAKVREIHPEISFAAMNGDAPVLQSKHTREGLEVREALLVNAFSERSISNVLGHPPNREFKRDDLLDALAGLWSAERIARSEGGSLPDPSERDSEGLTRAIHF